VSSLPNEEILASIGPTAGGHGIERSPSIERPSELSPIRSNDMFTQEEPAPGSVERSTSAESRVRQVLARQFARKAVQGEKVLQAYTYDTMDMVTARTVTAKSTARRAEEADEYNQKVKMFLRGGRGKLPHLMVYLVWSSALLFYW
jgi:hypothetical protein